MFIVVTQKINRTDFLLKQNYNTKSVWLIKFGDGLHFLATHIFAWIRKSANLLSLFAPSQF